LIDDIKEEMNNCLPPVDVEEIQGIYYSLCKIFLLINIICSHYFQLSKGEANVLEEFLINENKKKVPVAGCRCTSGTLKKAALFKVIRDPDTVIYSGM